ncbi:MAG: arsenate reductase (glutaredoxin) [bacterium]|nr:arsenate reductase (glutaredoxin) [bacterium]
MLEEHGIDFDYREYRKEPLSEAEIRHVLALLEVGPKDVLRRRDKAFRELGLSGDEPDSILIAHMAAHPTLLQRPIGVVGDRAVIGRPVENLLSLVD